MRIDKAIENLNIAKEGFPTKNAEEYYIAVELGIEALKAIENCRCLGPYPNDFLKLPGETDE